MDIVRFKGGLGNQMFQYALVEALRSRQREVGCSLGFYKNHPDLMPFILDQVFKQVDLYEVEDSVFQRIDERWKRIKSNETVLKEFKQDVKRRFFYVEDEVGKYDNKIFQTENSTFVGYWQTEKYFADIKDTIKEKYKFEDLEPDLRDFSRRLRKGYVSVHIRRNDYLNDSVYQTFSNEYYINAIQYIKKKMPEAKFIFFSDDREWVCGNFKLPDMIVCEPKWFDNYKDWYDMYLMTACQGNIIANSSFSWWGAWLNQNERQIVIAPDRWLNGRATPDIWCENWHRI